MLGVVSRDRPTVILRKSFDHSTKSIDGFNTNITVGGLSIEHQCVADCDEAPRGQHPDVPRIDRHETIATSGCQEKTVFQQPVEVQVRVVDSLFIKAEVSSKSQRWVLLGFLPIQAVA